MKINPIGDLIRKELKTSMKKLKDNILIFGNGQIGNFYNDYFNKRPGYKSVISKANVTKVEEVISDVDKYKPTVVINTAGKTNLEWIKDHELEAFNSNVLGANVVAKVCADKGVYYIFLSSGCIYESKDENDRKSEKDTPSPQAFYSWTKVWAENIIPWKKSNNFKYLILRPRQPISSKVSNKNMLIKLLTFTRFIDTPNTGTVIEDLMIWTEKLIEKRVVGTIHAANEGWSTPYRIALLLKKYVLPELEVNIMTKKELDAITPVKRVDTILNVDKLKKLIGAKYVRDYEERLEEVITQLGKNIRKEDKKVLKKVFEDTLSHTRLRATPNKVWVKLVS
jgi:dTDP-4-dehydrorhamnose reductase